MPVYVRQLVERDLQNGFLSTLHSLARVDLPPEKAREVYLDRLQGNIATFVAVDDKTNTVVGTASIIIDHKFINEGSCAALVEDVAVRQDWRGKGIGAMLMDELKRQAKRNGCYKVILSCDDEKELVGFYEGCGFQKHGVTMRLNLANPE